MSTPTRIANPARVMGGQPPGGCAATPGDIFTRMKEERHEPQR